MYAFNQMNSSGVRPHYSSSMVQPSNYTVNNMLQAGSMLSPGFMPCVRDSNSTTTKPPVMMENLVKQVMHPAMLQLAKYPGNDMTQCVATMGSGVLPHFRDNTTTAPATPVVMTNYPVKQAGPVQPRCSAMFQPTKHTGNGTLQDGPTISGRVADGCSSTHTEAKHVVTKNHHGRPMGVVGRLANAPSNTTPQAKPVMAKNDVKQAMFQPTKPTGNGTLQDGGTIPGRVANGPSSAHHTTEEAEHVVTNNHHGSPMGEGRVTNAPSNTIPQAKPVMAKNAVKQAGHVKPPIRQPKPVKRHFVYQERHDLFLANGALSYGIFTCKHGGGSKLWDFITSHFNSVFGCDPVLKKQSLVSRLESLVLSFKQQHKSGKYHTAEGVVVANSDIARKLQVLVHLKDEKARKKFKDTKPKGEEGGEVNKLVVVPRDGCARGYSTKRGIIDVDDDADSTSGRMMEPQSATRKRMKRAMLESVVNNQETQGGVMEVNSLHSLGELKAKAIRLIAEATVSAAELNEEVEAELKAEVGKRETEARIVEAEARKLEAECKLKEHELKMAILNAEVGKREAELKAEVGKRETDARLMEAEARKLEAECMLKDTEVLLKYCYSLSDK